MRLPPHVMPRLSKPVDLGVLHDFVNKLHLKTILGLGRAAELRFKRLGEPSITAKEEIWQAMI